MKIVNHSNPLPAPRAGAVQARGQPAPTDAAPRGQADAGARPVRISRFPEEAALFAYNRQAQPYTARPGPAVDEYV